MMLDQTPLLLEVYDLCTIWLARSVMRDTARGTVPLRRHFRYRQWLS
jgi:hypothetical protein